VTASHLTMAMLQILQSSRYLAYELQTAFLHVVVPQLPENFSTPCSCVCTEDQAE